MLVKERFGNSHWKLPGGYVDEGEDIDTAAVREVLEETGIHTEAKGIVAFRHIHKSGCKLKTKCLRLTLMVDF